MASVLLKRDRFLIPQTYTDINLLLLGEPKVGKSTFINAIINYLNYEDAVLKRLYLTPVPTDLEEEEEDKARDRFKSVRTYSIPVGRNVRLTILDSPGINDTPDDERICDDILTCLGQMPEIHGICFFTTPTDARTRIFEICVTRILMRLHPTACHNLIFIFTKCGDTDFSPGNDTIWRLRNIVNKFKICPPNLEIPFEKKNIFCVENKGFISLTDVKITSSKFYKKTWALSSNECHRLMMYITTELKPHKLQGSKSINEARRLIAEISPALADVAHHILCNIATVPKINELRTTEFDFPIVICTSRECAPSILFKSFREPCHSSCFSSNTFTAFPGDPGMLNCRKMKRTGERSSKCTKCFCNDDQHIRVSYLSYLYETDKEVFAEDQWFEELRDELHFIFKSMVLFAQFLENHFARAVPHSYQNYLIHLMDRPWSTTKEKIVTTRLMYLFDIYEEIKDDFDNKCNPSDITIEAVIDQIQQLYSLRRNGKDIYRLMNLQNSSKLKIYNELFTDVYRQVRVPSDFPINTTLEIEWLYKDRKAKSSCSDKPVNYVSPTQESEIWNYSESYNATVNQNHGLQRMMPDLDNPPFNQDQPLLVVASHDSHAPDQYVSETRRVQDDYPFRQHSLNPQLGANQDYNALNLNIQQIPVNLQQQAFRYQRNYRGRGGRRQQRRRPHRDLPPAPRLPQHLPNILRPVMGRDNVEPYFIPQERYDIGPIHELPQEYQYDHQLHVNIRPPAVHEPAFYIQQEMKHLLQEIQNIQQFVKQEYEQYQQDQLYRQFVEDLLQDYANQQQDDNPQQNNNAQQDDHLEQHPALPQHVVINQQQQYYNHQQNYNPEQNDNPDRDPILPQLPQHFINQQQQQYYNHQQEDNPEQDLIINHQHQYYNHEQDAIFQPNPILHQHVPHHPQPLDNQQQDDDDNPTLEQYFVQHHQPQDYEP